MTGGTGPLGTHLVELLASTEREVVVWSRGRTEAAPGDASPAARRTVDMRRSAAVERAVRDVQPAVIFHLAGVREGSPRHLVEGNVVAFANLLTALRAAGATPRCVVVGSSAQYGLRRTTRPVAESAAMDAATVYGATKAAQEALALAAWRSAGLEVVAARVFNMVGPRQLSGLLPADVARQLTDRRTRAVTVGDVDGTRDYLDYRDAARALVDLADRGAPGAAVNVCSGRAVALSDLVAQLVRLSGREVPVRPAAPSGDRGRPRHQVGDPSLIVAMTGWRPRLSLERSLRDLLGWWRDRAGAATS